jgi:hypothetical protein
VFVLGTLYLSGLGSVVFLVIPSLESSKSNYIDNHDLQFQTLCTLA